MRFDFKPGGWLAVDHLRFRRLWLGIGVLLIVCVVLGSVASMPSAGVMLHDKLLHTVVYAALMGWFAQIFRHDLTRLVLVLGLSGMGIAIEFIQAAVPHRQFEVLDMVANVSGVVLAWALAYTWVGNVLMWFETGFCRLILRSPKSVPPMG